MTTTFSQPKIADRHSTSPTIPIPYVNDPKQRAAMTGKDQKQDRPIEDLQAANEYRASLIERADAHHGHAPLWHGWAIFDAFLAGFDHARRQS
jgi:hypothetical protein